MENANLSSDEIGMLRAHMSDNYFYSGHDIFWNLSGNDISSFNVVNLSMPVVEEKENFERLKPLFLTSALNVFEECAEKKLEKCAIEYSVARVD